MDFDTSLAEGRASFAAGRFLKAQRVWAAGFAVTRGPQRKLLQVLVLWATAFHHRGRGNQRGALTVLARALDRLSALPDRSAPCDTQVLRDALVDSWERLSTAQDRPPTPPHWDPEGDQLEDAGLELGLRTRCPYCGEPVAVEVEPELASGAQYVEDCPVCCRPWTVTVRSEGGRVAIALGRDDE